MENPTPSRAQVEIVYPDKQREIITTPTVSRQESFEESLQSLQSLMSIQQKLMPDFEKNIEFLIQIEQRMDLLEKSREKELTAIIEKLKLYEEEMRQPHKACEEKNKQLHLGIITTVRKENEELPKAIKVLQASQGLQSFDIDTLKENIQDQGRRIEELEKKIPTLATIEQLLLEAKQRNEAIKPLQDQITFNLRQWSILNEKSEKNIQFIGILSVINLTALCAAFWMWWHTHRA